MAVEPPETLTFAVTQATLGRSPNLSPRASSLVVCPHCWGLGGSLPIQTSHGTIWHPYLRNGPLGERAHLSVAPSGSPHSYAH